jgi:hypothetical protein
MTSGTFRKKVSKILYHLGFRELVEDVVFESILDQQARTGINNKLRLIMDRQDILFNRIRKLQEEKNG